MNTLKKNWAQPSLSRDFALLSAVILFVLFLMAVWVTYETYQSHSEKIVKQLETEATRIDRTLIIEIENASYLITSLARQITYHGSGDKVYIAKLLKSFDVNATINNVFSWVDENQQNVVSSNRGVLDKPVDLSDRDYIKKTLTEPWKIQVGRPVEGRVSHKWILPVGMGLTDDTGKFIGTIVISLDIKALEAKIAHSIDQPGISFAVSSLTLTKIMEASSQENFFENNFPKEKLMAMDFRASPSGVFSHSSLLHPSQPYSFYELSSKYPYIIFLSYTPPHNEGLMNGLLLPRLLQLLLIALFFVALLWMIRLRVIRPVIDLSDVAAGIARGETALGLSKGGPMEIESLAQQLKKISDYITERRRIEEELQGKMVSLKKAKEAAELTNRIKVDFLSSMSQELRTPLNTIVAFSEVMKNQYYGPVENEKYLQYSQEIHQSGQQLLEIINDVVALSQAETGSLEMKEKPLKLAFILSKCQRLMQEKLQQGGVNLKIDLEESLPKILIDELRLKQIVLNLLTHCLKNTAAGGEIVVSAHLDNASRIGGQVSLSLTFRSATGTKPNEGKAGMPAETGKGTKEKVDFSGIALPLSKTLAAMHQAVLSIEQTAGSGYIITLRFPKERLVFWDQTGS